MREQSVAQVRELFETPRGRMVVVAFGALFLVLVTLSLAGFEFATGFLARVFGTLLGAGTGYAFFVLFRRWGNKVALAMGFLVWLALSVLLVVVVPFSVDGSLWVEGVYGEVIGGVGSGWLFGALVLPYLASIRYRPSFQEMRQNGRYALQGLVIFFGVLLSLVLLVVGFYLLVEFVVTPLARSLAG